VKDGLNTAFAVYTRTRFLVVFAYFPNQCAHVFSNRQLVGMILQLTHCNLNHSLGVHQLPVYAILFKGFSKYLAGLCQLHNVCAVLSYPAEDGFQDAHLLQAACSSSIMIQHGGTPRWQKTQ
jgi:hypothetical protein